MPRGNYFASTASVLVPIMQWRRLGARAALPLRLRFLCRVRFVRLTVSLRRDRHDGRNHLVEALALKVDRFGPLAKVPRKHQQLLAILRDLEQSWLSGFVLGPEYASRVELHKAGPVVAHIGADRKQRNHYADLMLRSGHRLILQTEEFYS